MDGGKMGNCYIVVSSIKDSIGNLVGYRLVEINTLKKLDVTLESLYHYVLSNPAEFINIRVNYRNEFVFATQSGTDMELPTLSTGRRLVTENCYTVGYSDSRGNLIVFDGHGEKRIVAPSEYIRNTCPFTNAGYMNGKMRGYFITNRLDKDYFMNKNKRMPIVCGQVMPI